MDEQIVVYYTIWWRNPSSRGGEHQVPGSVGAKPTATNKKSQKNSKPLDKKKFL